MAHDVFRTARYRNSRVTPTLISATRVRPKYPNIVLSLGYSFDNYRGRRAIARTRTLQQIRNEYK